MKTISDLLGRSIVPRTPARRAEAEFLMTDLIGAGTRTARHSTYEIEMFKCLHGSKDALGIRSVTRFKNRIVDGQIVLSDGRRLVGALRLHRAAMLKEGHAGKDRLVFCNKAGGFISRTNFLKRDLGPAIDRTNVKEREAAEQQQREPDLIPDRLRFHDLRHTHASLLLSAGHSLKAVSTRLGHASVEITLKVYAHCMPGDDERLTAGIGQLLKRA
jgi:hypothetical protein